MTARIPSKPETARPALSDPGAYPSKRNPRISRIVLAVLSAGLLELPFPLAGPMPAWRGVFAWFGLVPLLVALLWHAGAPHADRQGKPTPANRARPLLGAFLLAYLCGCLWYAGNCYWIYDTMHRHGDLPPLVSALILLGFSLLMGLYFALFGWSVALVRRALGSPTLALAAVPILWTAMEWGTVVGIRFPWDQLGYSQVDNLLLARMAAWTGVTGISFVLACGNALLAAGILLPSRNSRCIAGLAGVALVGIACAGLWMKEPVPRVEAVAVLMQPNLDVGSDNIWSPAEWDGWMKHFALAARATCQPYIDGIPETEAKAVSPDCPGNPPPPSLAAWPESPAQFAEPDPRFQQSMASVAMAARAPLIVGAEGVSFSSAEAGYLTYNSALVFAADGRRLGRYDKNHLVPFGEYVPFAHLLTFARSLTGRVSSLEAGTERKVFDLNGHRYGVFICYESVFGDEVRRFAQLGGEVFVNISDDGWYGDTSAPWQHLNMARMRAIENHRWILRDTNNGVTAAIDPYGIVRQSIPRHQVGALAAGYGFQEGVTWYAAHGDWFAVFCGIAALGIVGWAIRALLRG